MGLVQYDSSDEDEDVQGQEASKPSPTKTTLPSLREPYEPYPAPAPVSALEPATQAALSIPPSQPSSEPSPLGPIQGPILGPAAPPPTIQPFDPTAAPTDIDLSFLDPQPGTDHPRSPYTTARALSRDLTLPAVPNMDIPPSPPLTAISFDLAPLNAKFDTFLKLKRRARDPAHFNARLAASSAVRNPGLMDKLLGFVGIETEFVEGDGTGTEQYATTLGTEVWDPQGFPEWAYRGQLRRAQDRGNRERERGRGEAIEFVPSGTVDGGAGSVPVRGQRRTMFDT